MGTLFISEQYYTLCLNSHSDVQHNTCTKQLNVNGEIKKIVWNKRLIIAANVNIMNIQH